jgi:hypothetical protein
MMAFFRGIKLLLVMVKDFFVTWFMPLPAIDSFEEESAESESSSSVPGSDLTALPNAESAEDLTSGSVESSEGQSTPEEPETAPEVRDPEGAHERVPRNSGQSNPFV